MEPWRASLGASPGPRLGREAGQWAAASACLGQQEGWRLKGSSGATVTQVISLSLWLRQPVCCLLRSLSLYSLAFWVGLEWFLPGYFIFSGSASPAFYPPVCSAPQLLKPQIRDEVVLLQSLRPQSLSIL